MNEKFLGQIRKLRKQIEDAHYEQRDVIDQYLFQRIDEFLKSSESSDLERAFYLMLNQFASDYKNYFVVPHEEVLVRNVHDYSQLDYGYEIDFAIYSGSRAKPIKIAIECDGLRSHRQRHNERDRRKDVNLQAAGWIVVRIGSHEIHKELEAFGNDEQYISNIATNLENLVEQTMDLITPRSYTVDEIRSQLTGYEWGDVTCTQCGRSQKDRLNRTKFHCRHCREEFSKE
jgi:very-short-patch-repair endonuclease